MTSHDAFPFCENCRSAPIRPLRAGRRPDPLATRQGGRGVSYRLGGVSAEATPIADFTNDVSSTYAQLSSGPAQFSSAPAQLSSGDTQLSSGDDDFISQYVSRLSKEKQGELVEVAKTIMGKRSVAHSIRDQVIVTMCSIAPLSINEISSLIKSNSDHTHIALRRLMATGELRYLHPDRPNHPQQRYVAGENEMVDEGRV